MIKVFNLNTNGKIELTKKQLEQLLNESYWEGYNKKNTYVYTSPYTDNPPYYYYRCSNLTTDSITVSTSTGEE